MRIGFDIDGVLSNFYRAYEELHCQVAGVNKFPPLDEERGPGCWHWPTALHGYTDADTKAVWGIIKSDPKFWRNLSEHKDFGWLRGWWRMPLASHAETYFITDRPGILPVRQTQDWFADRGILANVVVSAEKGEMARLLKLDAYIDDRWENCVAVSYATDEACQPYIVDRNYNRPVDNPQHFPEEPMGVRGGLWATQEECDAHYGLRRVASLSEFLTEINGQIVEKIAASAPTDAVLK